MRRDPAAPGAVRRDRDVELTVAPDPLQRNARRLGGLNPLPDIEVDNADAIRDADLTQPDRPAVRRGAEATEGERGGAG